MESLTFPAELDQALDVYFLWTWLSPKLAGLRLFLPLSMIGPRPLFWSFWPPPRVFLNHFHHSARLWHLASLRTTQNSSPNPECFLARASRAFCWGLLTRESDKNTESSDARFWSCQPNEKILQLLENIWIVWDQSESQTSTFQSSVTPSWPEYRLITLFLHFGKRALRYRLCACVYHTTRWLPFLFPKLCQ